MKSKWYVVGDATLKLKRIGMLRGFVSPAWSMPKGNDGEKTWSAIPGRGLT